VRQILSGSGDLITHVQTDYHRVMIRSPVGIRSIDGILGILLEGHVIVDQVRLIGVDVPIRCTGDFTQQP